MRDPEAITAFEDRLTEVLYALDTPAHAKAARARGDWFLYVRCAAVAAGRDTYESILANPAMLRRFSRREAELLLAVASTAYERSTGRPWEYETQLSYESGSNSTAWGGPMAGQEAEPAEHQTDVDAWLTVRTANPHVDRRADALRADPGWRAWWSTSGIPRCSETGHRRDLSRIVTVIPIDIRDNRVMCPVGEHEQILPRASPSAA